MKRCMAMLVLLVVVVVVGIRLIDRQPVDAGPSYEEALAATAPGVADLMLPGSPGADAALARLQAFWADLSAPVIRDTIGSVYAGDVWFYDTVHTITNLADLEHYMVETAERVAACRVQFLDIMPADGGYFIRWKMTIVPFRDRPDETWESYGISHFRFNAEGRVVLHRDYWDSGRGMYEHLPVVGWILRNVRARL